MNRENNTNVVVQNIAPLVEDHSNAHFAVKTNHTIPQVDYDQKGNRYGSFKILNQFSLTEAPYKELITVAEFQLWGGDRIMNKDFFLRRNRMFCVCADLIKVKYSICFKYEDKKFIEEYPVFIETKSSVDRLSMKEIGLHRDLFRYQGENEKQLNVHVKTAMAKLEQKYLNQNVVTEAEEKETKDLNAALAAELTGQQVNIPTTKADVEREEAEEKKKNKAKGDSSADDQFNFISE